MLCGYLSSLLLAAVNKRLENRELRYWGTIHCRGRE